MLKWSVQVNVLLNNCKQNITSLSLLVGTTVHCHAMFHLQCVDLGYCLCDATTALTGPLTGIAADGATGQLLAGGGDCIIAPYTQTYTAGSKSPMSRSIHYSYQLILDQTLPASTQP